MRAVFLSLLLLVFLVPGGPTGIAAAQTWDSEPLTITKADGETHRFTVELALTVQDQGRGLMHRKFLGPDQGMLFVYRRVQRVSMWMKNTFIPLDMLFIDAQGGIARIHERAVPHSETIIPSGGPVRAVLEVKGGTVSRLGLKPGDRVHHPALKRFGGRS
ncbi:MAG: DUF192 domain-containing protein [Alphaproteobacteria bacterium]|nr:DUF192 domain-containing protein [Alphaproteobacteria bacterium]